MSRSALTAALPRSAIASRLYGLHAYLAATVVLIGLGVLTGWATGIQSLKTVVPGMTSMKVNTAVGLICLALALLGLNRRSAVWRAFVPACLALVSCVALGTLAEYALGVDLRIDNALIRDTAAIRFPGRNAPATNVAFLGLAAALLLLYARRAVTFAQILLMIVSAAPLTSLGGYLYRAPGMYQSVAYSAIALHTSAALMLLCLGALCARADEAFMGIVTSDSVAGSLARKLLPAAVGLPLMTGLAVLAGERAGWYTGAFGSALIVASCATFFGLAVCWSVSLLWKADLRREAAERERGRLLEAEQQARGEAERANRIKDEFLSVVSHELRTPLNAMLGWSQLLRVDAGPELDQGLEIIERNGHAQKQIIEDLLDMGRIISGKIRLDVSRMSLPATIAAAVDTVTPAADAKGVRLEQTIDATIEPVYADAARLQQVVWNLLSNAIKFTAKGGHVHVHAERLVGGVKVSVSDTGEGVAAEMLPFVFDRFRQADASASRRHGGLGLGLSIVKQLVELHGGTVGVSSAGRFHGATFTVTLPQIAAGQSAVRPAPPRPSTDSVTGPTGPASDLARLRILVVDDEADARALVRRILEDRDAVVHTAGCVAEAVTLLNSKPFDVLVSDIGMPGEDGYSFLRRVRGQVDSTRKIPAIALTAYARAEDRAAALAAGFGEHLTKPVDPAKLVATIVALAVRPATLIPSPGTPGEG